MSELKLCPVMWLGGAVLSAFGQSLARPAVCIGAGCGAYNLCSARADLEDLFDEEEDDDDDDDDGDGDGDDEIDHPDEVEDEDGQLIEVIPRTAARMELLAEKAINELRRQGTKFESITCLDCDAASMCEFAFHIENIDGNCMAEK